MRLHLFIVLGIFLIGFIIGSFVDLNLMKALFSKDNGFGLTIAAIGTIPGYGVFAILGGGFFWLFTQNSFKKPVKFIFFICSIIGLGCGIYFSGKEWFGENGFYNKDIYWVGFLISLPIMVGFYYLGYFFSKKYNNPRVWILYAALAIAAFMALVAGVTLIKAIFHRPRYRIAVYEGIVPFHEWWNRCGDYKNYLPLISKEEFKSFPSGHTGGALTFLYFATFSSLFMDKKFQLPIFYAGVAWALFVAFTRILVGAHFLSDVSMGGLLSIVCLIIANEVVIKLRVAEE